MKKIVLFSLFLVLSLAVYAEGQMESPADAAIETVATQAKYVFLFIGDGMAMPQINAAEAYLNAKAQTAPGVAKLGFTQFPSQGLTTTYDAGSFITDSASAGTAIATGNKTLSGVINMDVTKTEKFTTIAELAKEGGRKVGIISSVNLDHATPACFYAKQASRNSYYDINMQLARSNFDYFAGGMVRIDKTPEGEKNAHEVMKDNGWIIASNRDEFSALAPSDRQVYAYYSTSFTRNSLDYALDMEEDDITLAEFTRKGIELLDNEDGFFIMVEGGKIDWACHANDAAASISNTLAFDNAVDEAIEFYARHPKETLIVVTGDHETGGLTLGFAGTKYDSAFKEIDKQKMSYEAFNAFVLGPYKKAHADSGNFEDIRPEIEEYFGLTELTEYEEEMLVDAFHRSMKGEEVISSRTQDYLLYGGYEPLTVTLTHLLNQRAGLGWTSYSHTGVPVQTFALGEGHELFNGYYDNTDIFKKMYSIMFGQNTAAVAVAE
ncbi:MAG: alkaline phosphatase [Spirochaetia bacterium]|nr:alkaline phosphatase [Spirochaetia bacterium]